MLSGNCRSPDISFFVKEGLGGTTQLGFLDVGFWDDAPDLAVEILLPRNTVAEIEEKLNDYFVLVYPCPPEPDHLLKSGDKVTLEFSLPLAELFQPLAF